jgi:hypothetical protein
VRVSAATAGAVRGVEGELGRSVRVIGALLE